MVYSIGDNPMTPNIAAVQQMIQARQARQARQAAVPNSDPTLDKLISDLQSGSTTDPSASTGTPVASGSAALGRAIGAPAAAPTSQPTGNLAQWISQAEKVVGLDPSYTAGINSMVQHESGGNPNSINKWDSNAKAGHPSQGLMQTIPGTFQEYALPGYNKSITDPVSNLIAGLRYAQRNYGNGMIKAGGRHNAQGKYIGY